MESNQSRNTGVNKGSCHSRLKRTSSKSKAKEMVEVIEEEEAAEEEAEEEEAEEEEEA